MLNQLVARLPERDFKSNKAEPLTDPRSTTLRMIGVRGLTGAETSGRIARSQHE